MKLNSFGDNIDKVWAIDPGPALSGHVLYDMATGQVKLHGKIENNNLSAMIENWIKGGNLCHFAIEKVASYGRPVGADVFETVFWTGRLYEMIYRLSRETVKCMRIERRLVKMHLCGTTDKVTDAAIRRRITDLYGPERKKAVGTKKKPGPLYGVRADAWQALALAITFAEWHMGFPSPHRG